MMRETGRPSEEEEASLAFIPRDIVIRLSISPPTIIESIISHRRFSSSIPGMSESQSVGRSVGRLGPTENDRESQSTAGKVRLPAPPPPPLFLPRYVRSSVQDDDRASVRKWGLSVL